LPVGGKTKPEKSFQNWRKEKMSKRVLKPIPTDEEILSYDNVPVNIAARYLGFSSNTIYYALQERRAPFGFAMPHESDATHKGFYYTYYISPAKLVACKRDATPFPTVGTVEIEMDLNYLKEAMQKLLKQEKP